MIQYIDTHCHLDGEEFAEDREEVVARAKAAGVSAIFLPAIDVKSCQTVLDTCAQYPAIAIRCWGSIQKKSAPTGRYN